MNQAPVITIRPTGLRPVGVEALTSVTTQGDQSGTITAPLAGGGYVALWSSGATSTSIKYSGRIFAADGSGGAEFAVATAGTGFTGTPFDPTPVLDVVALNGGGFVVVWQEADASGTNIVGRRYDASGVPIGVAFAVSDNAAPHHFSPIVVAQSSGGFAVVWMEDQQRDFASQPELYIRHFDASGAPTTTDIRVAGAAAGPSLPAISTLPDGRLVLAFSGTDRPNNAERVYAQIRDSAGSNLTGGNLVFGGITEPGSTRSQVAGLADGNFVIVRRVNSSFSADVVTPAGAVIRTIALPISTAGVPEVTAMPNGFMLVWSGGGEIRARVFDLAGSAVGGELTVNTNQALLQTSPAAIAFADGSVLVTWTSEEPSEFLTPQNTLGVYQQRFAPVYLGIEQLPTNLKGTISVSDADAGAGAVLTATLSVSYGVLNVTVGNSGATLVSGNGSGSVSLSGTLTQLNALLGAASTSTVSYTPDTDVPPASANLTLAVNDGIDTSQTIATIAITAVDDLPTAVADAGALLANATLTITVLGNDLDPDGGPRGVAQIAGVTAVVGTAVTLASGARVTLNADGTISYDPNGRFDALVSAVTAALSGATNTQATDSFTYVLNGGSSATATLTITGVDGAGDRLLGSAAANVISGTTGGDFIDVSQGGDDNVNAGGGNDGIFFGGAFTVADFVDGGAGLNDQLGLQGDYKAGLTLSSAQMVGVEIVALLPTAGAGYRLTTTDDLVDAATTLTFYASELALGQDFTLDASAESSGAYRVFGGLGTDVITTGGGNDGIYFGEGRFNPAVDRVQAGAGDNDQLALDGNYRITIDGDAVKGVEVIALLDGRSDVNNTYHVKLADSLVPGAGAMTIWAVPVRTQVIIDAGAETNVSASYLIYGGQAGDGLFGGAGVDRLSGGGGSDTLRGEGGKDLFVFEGAPLGPNNVDIITDYHNDLFVLHTSVFPGLRPGLFLPANAFRENNQNSQATTPDERIIFNRILGEVYFDVDGVGGLPSVLFARVTFATTFLSANDFWIIS